MSNLLVRQIESRRDVETFLRTPWSIYADDPHWIPPLLSDLRERLTPAKNPYFEHAEAAYFVAQRDGKTVGRISAQVCQLVQEHHGEGTGHFGFFECEDSQQTTDSLFDAVEQWLITKGMHCAVGPFNLSINDEIGVLVDGFHRPPHAFMGHHRPYYDARILGAGLKKERDVYSYYQDITLPYSNRIQSILDRTARDARIRVRPMDRKDVRGDVNLMLDVFNDAWEDNWGHIPFTQAEAQHLERTVRSYLSNDSVMLAELDGQAVGFIVVLPNLNELIHDLDGRLFPTGWLRLLWRMKFRQCASIRLPLMGLRKELQRSRAGAAIALAMIDQCRRNWLRKGATHCEMSWILEDNGPMRSILEASGSARDKTYRIYSKPLRRESSRASGPDSDANR